MQKKFFLLALLQLIAILGFSQYSDPAILPTDVVCVIDPIASGGVLQPDGSYIVNWDSNNPPKCYPNPGSIKIDGTTPANVIVIPNNVNLVFSEASGTTIDYWKGRLLIVEGTLTIDCGLSNNCTSALRIDASIKVTGTFNGLFNINTNLAMGSQSDCTGVDALPLVDGIQCTCPYIVTVEPGAVIDLNGGAADRLKLCGVPLLSGASSGSCIQCYYKVDGTLDYCDPWQANKPFCTPADDEGITGPIVISTSGLPIELLFFKGFKKSTSISLSWATASELNFDYFEIQKSHDGLNFNVINNITGHGTTNERKDYSFEDEKPYIGRNYYRLKSVDFDGYSEVFDVIMVEYNGDKNFSVYPNPSEGYHVETETNFVPLQSAYISIHSSTGYEKARFKVDGGRSTLNMPVKLESGWYYARFISSEFTSVSRFLVR